MSRGRIGFCIFGRPEVGGSFPVGASVGPFLVSGCPIGAPKRLLVGINFGGFRASAGAFLASRFLSLSYRRFQIPWFSCIGWALLWFPVDVGHLPVIENLAKKTSFIFWPNFVRRVLSKKCRELNGCTNSLLFETAFRPARSRRLRRLHEKPSK